MPSFLVDSFSGGFADYEKKGIPGSFKGGSSNLDIRKETRDTLSCKQALVEEGLLAGSRSSSASVSPSASPSSSPSLSPSASVSPTPSPSASTSPSVSVSKSPSPTPSRSPSLSPSVSAAMTSVFRDLIRFFVNGSDGYTYGFGHTGWVYRRDSSAFWQRVNKIPGAILGAAEWYSNSGKTYLYIAIASTLYRKELPGRSDWNDLEVVAQNLTPATWHTMRECGGSLIICNAGNLALVGYDESYTNNALDLIPGNIANTVVERNGRTIVGTARKSNLTQGVNAAIDTEVPLAQAGENGELFFADMVNSVPVRKFPGGGKVNPGGVCNEINQMNFFEWEQNALSWIDKHSVGNMSLWAVYSTDAGYTGVYSYGRYNKNKPFVLNLDYLIENADELGAITVTDDGTMLVSYQEDSDYGVLAVDPNNKATGTYVGLDFRAPNKKPSQITNWKYAEIFCDPLPSGSSIEFWYRVDKTGNWTRAITGDGDTNFDTVNAQKAVFLLNVEGKVFEHKVILKPYGNNSPEVHWIETFFD